MARTLVQRREAILAWHTTGYTNGPVEGLNSLIKKLKRVAAGFRSFTNYRLRILLAVGGCNWDLPGRSSRATPAHSLSSARSCQDPRGRTPRPVPRTRRRSLHNTTLEHIQT
jgi:hypothetical protein